MRFCFLSVWGMTVGLVLCSPCASMEMWNRTELTAIVDAPTGEAVFHTASPQGQTVRLKNGTLVIVLGLPVSASEAGLATGPQAGSKAASQSKLLPVESGSLKGFLAVDQLRAVPDVLMPTAKTPNVYLSAHSGSKIPVRFYLAPTGLIDRTEMIRGVDFSLTESDDVVSGKLRSIIATSEESQDGPDGNWLDASKPFAALPHGKAMHKSLSVQRVDASGEPLGKVVTMSILDMGPWRTDDDYWNKGKRPVAEGWKGWKVKYSSAERGWVPSSSGTLVCNGAGIDLSFGAWMKLKPGLSSSQALSQMEPVNWWFSGK